MDKLMRDLLHDFLYLLPNETTMDIFFDYLPYLIAVSAFNLLTMWLVDKYVANNTVIKSISKPFSNTLFDADFYNIFIIAPLIEEVLFRLLLKFYVLEFNNQKLPENYNAINAVCFGLFHIQNIFLFDDMSTKYLSIIFRQIISTTFLGYLLSKCNDFYVALLFHIIYNVAGIHLYILMYKYCLQKYYNKKQYNFTIGKQCTFTMKKLVKKIQRRNSFTCFNLYKKERENPTEYVFMKNTPYLYMHYIYLDKKFVQKN